MLIQVCVYHVTVMCVYHVTVMCGCLGYCYGFVRCFHELTHVTVFSHCIASIRFHELFHPYDIDIMDRAVTMILDIHHRTAV